jgi:predicted transcriptional regulator
MRKVPVPLLTSFRLDHGLRRALDDLAAEQKRKPSKIIRQAIQEYLAREARDRSLQGYRDAA